MLWCAITRIRIRRSCKCKFLLSSVQGNVYLVVSFVNRIKDNAGMLSNFEVSLTHTLRALVSA